MKMAMFIKRVNLGASDALYYKLSDPMSYEDNGIIKKTLDIVVSATEAPDPNNKQFIKQTYIFPADENGNILSMEELEGSMDGTLDHEEALKNAGYETC